MNRRIARALLSLLALAGIPASAGTGATGRHECRTALSGRRPVLEVNLHNAALGTLHAVVGIGIKRDADGICRIEERPPLLVCEKQIGRVPRGGVDPGCLENARKMRRLGRPESGADCVFDREPAPLVRVYEPGPARLQGDRTGAEFSLAKTDFAVHVSNAGEYCRLETFVLTQTESLPLNGPVTAVAGPAFGSPGGARGRYFLRIPVLTAEGRPETLRRRGSF